jgi:anti-sigma regulatory factor (Ser/Thr protein kinase)
MGTRHDEGLQVFSGSMPSQLEARDELIDQILQSVAAHGFRPDPHFHRLCLDEAISNAIIHGNRSDRSKSVIVRVFAYETQWSVEVMDEGVGFDWQEWIARVKENRVDSPDSGRGIAILLKCCHEVQFAEGGRKICLIWRLDDATSSNPASD